MCSFTRFSPVCYLLFLVHFSFSEIFSCQRNPGCWSYVFPCDSCCGTDYNAAGAYCWDSQYTPEACCGRSALTTVHQPPSTQPTVGTHPSTFPVFTQPSRSPIISDRPSKAPWLESSRGSVSFRINALPNLFSSVSLNTSDSVRFRIEFINTRDCSLGMVQLGEIRFYDKSGNKIRPTTFIVVDGDSPAEEQPANAIDDTIFRKWVDRSFQCGSRLTTYLTISSIPATYEFITANDNSHRDPVTWSMEMCYVAPAGYSDCTEQDVIDAYAPNRRWTSYGRFSVPAVALPTSTPTVSPSHDIPTLSPTSPTQAPSTIFEHCPYILVGAPCRTNRPVDMVLLLDSSSSILDEDMENFLFSLADIVNTTSFNVTKFGMAMFATFTEERVPIDEYTSVELSEAILQCERLRGATYMDHAFSFVLDMWEPHLDAGHVQNVVLFTDGVPSNGHSPCDLISDFHAVGIGFIIVAIETANENLDVFRCFADQHSIVMGFESFVETIINLQEVISETRSCDTLPTTPYDSQYEPTGEFVNGKPKYQSISQGWEITFDSDLGAWAFTDPVQNLGVMYDLQYTNDWKPPTGSEWMYVNSSQTFQDIPILCMDDLLDTPAPTSASHSSSPSRTPTTSGPSSSPTSNSPSAQPVTSEPTQIPSNRPSQSPTTPFPSQSPTIQDCDTFILCSDCISPDGDYEFGRSCTLDFLDEICGWYVRSEEIFQDHYVYIGEEGAELYFLNGKWEIYLINIDETVAQEREAFLPDLNRPATMRDWVKSDGSPIPSLLITCLDKYYEPPSALPTQHPFPENPHCCTFIFGSDCMHSDQSPDASCEYDVQTPFNGMYSCDGVHMRKSTFSTDSGYQMAYHGQMWQITHSMIGYVIGASEVCNRTTSVLSHPPSSIDWIWLYDSTPFLTVPITCQEDFPPKDGNCSESVVDLQTRITELSEEVEQVQTECTQTCDAVLTDLEKILET